jgi:hypothetical protein
VDVLRLLVFSGRADLAAADDEGFTPFMLAAQQAGASTRPLISPTWSRFWSLSHGKYPWYP